MLNTPVMHARVSSGTQASDAPLPTFEVASVKKHPENEQKQEGIMMGGPDVSQFRTSNVTMKTLIATAYGVKEFQIAGGPGWINSERWDIDAKVEDSVAEQLQKLPRQQEQAQKALMLRSLLLDRFALRVTRGAKEGTVLALAVAKGGPKLKEVPPPDPLATTELTPGPLVPGQVFTPPPGQALMMRSKPGAADYTMAANAVPIAALVNQLSMQLDRHVVDQTGLKGTYQYTLQFGGMPPPGAEAESDNNTASIFTALQEQLGLKLESTKGQIDTITIDRIEEPTPN